MENIPTELTTFTCAVLCCFVFLLCCAALSFFLSKHLMDNQVMYIHVYTTQKQDIYQIPSLENWAGPVKDIYNIPTLVS